MGECKAAVVQESVLLKYLFDGTLLYINNEVIYFKSLYIKEFYSLINFY